jgi:hypothetical protein
VVGLRTTNGASGPARCIVTGMGATPELALAVLRQAAEEEAQRAGERAAQAAEALEADITREREARQERPEKDRLREERRRQEERRETYYKQHPEHRGHGVPAWVLGPRTEEVAGDKLRPVKPPDDVPRDVGPREYWFEVVDVRLTPAPGEGGGGGWLAYGTLAREGPPRQVTTTGSGSGSNAGDPADIGHRDDRDDKSRGGRDTR